MAALVIVFAIVFISINIKMNQESIKQTEFMLERIAENDGAPPLPMKEGTENKPPQDEAFSEGKLSPPFDDSEHKNVNTSRFFFAKTDSNYAISEIYSDLMYDFTKEDISSYIESAISGGKTRGSLNKFEYLVAQKDYGYIIVFAERSVEIGMLGSLLTISLWAAGISCTVLFVFVIILSRWIVKPVETAFNKQKLFVSDASHELKTPLTIISTNADVLENEIGSNQRIDNIRTQTTRMNNLVGDLLSLTRTDEEAATPTFSRFDLSAAVLSTTLEFESYAFENQKALSYAIPEGIELTGDEEKIKQLLGILLDNAIKHSSPNSYIFVELTESSGHSKLSVSNTGSAISKESAAHIFDRFYRDDSSRSRKTGGYGLGLAIAKSIVDMHKGKIRVKSEGAEGTSSNTDGVASGVANSVTFEVKL